MEDGFASKLHVERIFFIVDRSRLKDEKDELKNAIVVYVPEKDLSKPSLEQRCSQLVGISILILGFTGKLPKFIRLKSNGFAVRQLGSDLIMGLQSKFDEPKSCVYQLINRIHDLFCFYYSSPSRVMEMAQQDWEIFTAQMSAIFLGILEFTLKEGRTLPCMFNPLPYVPLDPHKGGTQLYIKAQRLLRKCQLNEAVIGGCMFHGGELLCSQFPPDINEMLLIVANSGIELNSRSLLEDQLAPESVWIINIYLTSEQLALTNHLRRRTKGLKTMYAESLKPNPDLESQIQASQRYQNSHIDKSPNTESKREKNASSSSAAGKNQKSPVSRSKSDDSEDFVTISYGSNSVSFTKKTSVNPLKRSKVDGKRALDDISTTSMQRRGIFDPLPPLPNRHSVEETPPPIPQRNADFEIRSPPVPPNRKQNKELVVPKPPPRKRDQPPEPPPRLSYKRDKPGDNSKDIKPPSPPPRLARRSDSSPLQPPPPIPPSRKLDLNVQATIDEKVVDSTVNENSSAAVPIENNEETQSPSDFSTPRSSFDVAMKDEVNSESQQVEDTQGSDDQSEGYRTPAPASPASSSVKEIFGSASGSSIGATHFQSLTSTPPVGAASLSGNNDSDDCHTENDKVSYGGINGLPEENDEEGPEFRSFTNDSVIEEATDGGENSTVKGDVVDQSMLPNDSITPVAVIDDEENHYEFDEDMPILNIKRSKKISTSSMASSDSSLVITKAVSEVWESDDESPDQRRSREEDISKLYDDMNNRVERKPIGHGTSDAVGFIRQDHSEDSSTVQDDDEDHSLHESISDFDDEVQTDKYISTMAQTRKDKWGTLMSPNRNRTNHANSGIVNHDEDEAPVMHQKCLYVQKCVNTVVAILADEHLPESSELIKNLWTTLLSWLVIINNSVEPSLKDLDSIYLPTDNIRPESNIKAYHAGYSTNVAMCEVSSITAPYQFRHAVRRVHQEYSQDSSLRQVSLFKDHCKMISQNVLGREVYYHCNRVGSNDALQVHALIEKQVKQASKQNFAVSDSYTVNFL